MVETTHLVAKGDYRYGFQAQEKDDEIKGRGNSSDFGVRIQGPHLGRFLSRDVLELKKPNLSPYQSFKNNSILYNDSDGNDEYISIILKDRTGKKLGTIRGNKAVSNKVIAGPVMEAGNSTSIYETQKFYNFRKVYTITLNQDGSYSLDPIPRIYTIESYNPKYSITMFSSILSSYKEGSIVDPYKSRKSFGDIEGDGGSQGGGYTFISNTGGASHTKQKSLSPAEERNIDDLLIYFGAGQKSLYPNLSKDVDAIKDIMNNIKSMVEEFSGERNQDIVALKIQTWQKDEDGGWSGTNTEFKSITRGEFSTQYPDATLIQKGAGKDLDFYSVDRAKNGGPNNLPTSKR